MTAIDEVYIPSPSAPPRSRWRRPSTHPAARSAWPVARFPTRRLQALTLLNDPVFQEAAQALGQLMAARGGSIEERVEALFQRCLARPPDREERSQLARFFQSQKRRFELKELDAAKIAGPGSGEANERAAWTVLARVILNLDESIIKG